MFLYRRWNLSGLKTLTKNIDNTGTVDWCLGRGWPHTVRRTAVIDQVVYLILSQEGKTHDIMSDLTADRLISQCHRQKLPPTEVFEELKTQELTNASNKFAWLHRCRQLLRCYPAFMVNFVWFTDKKCFLSQFRAALRMTTFTHLQVSDCQ